MGLSLFMPVIVWLNEVRMRIYNFDGYEKALKKAENPNMTTDGNPLARGRDAYLKEKIVENNMDRLERDARRRNGPHGAVYEGIMSTRYNGGN